MLSQNSPSMPQVGQHVKRLLRWNFLTVLGSYAGQKVTLGSRDFNHPKPSSGPHEIVDLPSCLWGEKVLEKLSLRVLLLPAAPFSIGAGGSIAASLGRSCCKQPMTGT